MMPLNTTSKHLLVLNRSGNEKTNIILQKLNYTNAIKNLNLTLGNDIEKKWILSDTINTEIKIFSYEELKANTIANNTNIKNQYYNIQLSKQDINLAKSPFYPIISINSGGNFNESTYDIGNLSSTINNTGQNINYFDLYHF